MRLEAGFACESDGDFAAFSTFFGSSGKLAAGGGSWAKRNSWPPKVTKAINAHLLACDIKMPPYGSRKNLSASVNQLQTLLMQFYSLKTGLG
jgi:hypothetical protein